MFGLIPWRKEAKGEAVVPRITDPFELVRREMDAVFNRFFGDRFFPVTPLWEGERVWGLEQTENEKEVVIRAELPGFEPAEIEVSLRGNVLMIAAEHKPTEKEGEGRFTTVRRSLTLPEGLDFEKVEARYHNGVLEVHLPRKPEVQPKRIQVKT